MSDKARLLAREYIRLFEDHKITNQGDLDSTGHLYAIANEVLAEDIVETIGKYVKLHKAGEGFLGLCPFHKEKTASFYVLPREGRFHCFSCGVSGTAEGFLAHHLVPANKNNSQIKVVLTQQLNS